MKLTLEEASAFSEAELLIQHYGSHAAEEALAIAVEAVRQGDLVWAMHALRVAQTAFRAFNGNVPWIFNPDRFPWFS